jgi:hypothetical protein
MHIAKFLGIFSVRDDIAIEPEEDVRKALLEFGCKDEVYFCPDPKMKPGIVRGSIEHYEKMIDGEKVRCAEITYSSQMPHEWQRLVACKELLHILDPVEACMKTPEQVEHLIAKIVLPPELQDPTTDGYGVVTDRMMVAYAVAILFPMGAREKYMKLLEAGAKTLADAVEDVGIPLEYIKWVVSPLWPEYHTQLVKLR